MSIHANESPIEDTFKKSIIIIKDSFAYKYQRHFSKLFFGL